MIEFDYISDDRLRASLAADYAEFQACMSAESWKASVVLLGSIVEALLVDHLLAANYEGKHGRDPLKMQLNDLIGACEKEKVISSRTAALSTVLQSYRNLIHPGRSLRLKEVANRSVAVVAGELLQMIVAEIAASKRREHGYTAAQILGKLQRDESAMSILKHLLREVPEFELERLLVKLLPERYFELGEIVGDFGDAQPDVDGQNRLAVCFRYAFSLASDELKKKVTKNFLSILKEEHHYKVFTYETAFFKAEDLAYLPASESKIVKDHLVSRMKENISIELVKALDGLPKFLDASDISGVVDALLRHCLVKGGASELGRACRKYLCVLWADLPSGDSGDALVSARLDDWVSHFEKQANSESAELVREIKLEVEAVPF